MAVKRPNGRRNLDMAIRRLGDSDESYVRNRTSIANALVASMLPNGVVKGGTALKLRFGEKNTRSTNDLDTARSLSLEAFLREFEEALVIGWEGFTGRLVSIEPAHPDAVPSAYVMQPFDVKLSYQGGAWCTVPLEIGHNELGDADNPEFVDPVDANAMLQAVGFPPLPPIATMGLHHQIAQKIHGASEPGSMRAHDLIDLQLIVARGDIDWKLVRETCERLFAYRKRQPWPTKIVKGSEWETLYAAQRTGDVLPTVDEAIERANCLIERIASS